jgi:hypothetical protein
MAKNSSVSSVAVCGTANGFLMQSSEIIKHGLVTNTLTDGNWLWTYRSRASFTGVLWWNLHYQTQRPQKFHGMLKFMIVMSVPLSVAQSCWNGLRTGKSVATETHCKHAALKIDAL